ncbi:hypothetical protein [Halorussus marinus]|uniref:hypothetical protein n=1 Tax=Halorussus marinus TaxID=2505976 RepID=UPI001091FBCF|nr:hypothetical protein [Halorussus marinus]
MTDHHLALLVANILIKPVQPMGMTANALVQIPAEISITTALITPVPPFRGVLDRGTARGLVVRPRRRHHSERAAALPAFPPPPTLPAEAIMVGDLAR